MFALLLSTIQQETAVSYDKESKLRSVAPILFYVQWSRWHIWRMWCSVAGKEGSVESMV